MQSKGDKLGEVKQTLTRAPSQTNSVNNKISLAEIESDVPDEVFVELYRLNKNERKPLTDFITNVWDSEDAFTIGTDVINQHDIKPGETVLAKIYETDSSEDAPDTSQSPAGRTLLDQANAMKDKTNSGSDGVYSGLHSTPAYEYLQDAPGELLFCNIDSGKQAKAIVSPHSSQKSIQFPLHLRREIKTSPGDRIQLWKPETESDEPPTEASQTTRQNELIEDMHAKITELYDAYCEAKDD